MGPMQPSAEAGEENMLITAMRRTREADEKVFMMINGRRSLDM